MGCASGQDCRQSSLGLGGDHEARSRLHVCGAPFTVRRVSPHCALAGLSRCSDVSNCVPIRHSRPIQGSHHRRDRTCFRHVHACLITVGAAADDKQVTPVTTWVQLTDAQNARTTLQVMISVADFDPTSMSADRQRPNQYSFSGVYNGRMRTTQRPEAPNGLPDTGPCPPQPGDAEPSYHFVFCTPDDLLLRAPSGVGNVAEEVRVCCPIGSERSGGFVKGWTRDFQGLRRDPPVASKQSSRMRLALGP